MHSKSDQISELTHQNQQLENYFANTIIPQLFVDRELILRKFTPPAMKQFRLKAEHIGAPLSEVAENFRYPTIIENIRTVISSGELLEKEIQTTDMCWYQMNILPYKVPAQNRTNGVIITFVDITLRIKDLREQEKLIAEHELLLDTITHDIKNPILALGLTVQLLKKLPKKSEQQLVELLENLEISLKDMKGVVEGLIDSRWHSQKAQPAEELLDLGNILEDVRLTLSPQIQQSGAIITQHLRSSEITFARRKLRSVLYNLLANAICYTPAGRTPKIEISATEQQGDFVISVSDNGMGLSESEKGTIFEKFKRVRQSGEGSGVGLYLVHTIVASKGGKITVESCPGKGSTFAIYLPLPTAQPV